MTQHPHPSTAALWARFRFSVVGSLLSSPPARGELKTAIRSLATKTWTYQLHYDNLAALVKTNSSLGPLRSYSTVRRYMKAHGLVRKARAQPKGRPGEARAARRRETREIRSYEALYVGSLWHLDFHHGSLKVLTPRGAWRI